MRFMFLVSVFMVLFGFVPVLMILLGALEGGYEAFIKGFNEDNLGWIFLLFCFPIGLFGTWKTQKIIDKRDLEKELYN
jgi:hypothetical protein